MGKIFLLAIVIGAIWGVWSIAAQWKKRMSPPEGAGANSVQVAEPAAVAKPVAMPEVAHEDDEKKSECPSVLFVQAWSADFLQIEGYGLVRRGDLLPDGSTLVSWYRVGSDMFAEARSRARRVVLRFERLAECAVRRVYDYVPPVQLVGTNSVVAAGVSASP